MLQSLGTDFDHATDAEDMKDCYHHLVCEDAVLDWVELSAYWELRGVSWISLPRRPGSGLARFGKYERSGWVSIRFEEVATVLEHFAATNYVQVGDAIGREARGAPMGDALSGTVLRLWKWRREQRTATHEAYIATAQMGSRIIHASIHGAAVVALEVSYRDNTRTFAAWPRSANVTAASVLSWARERWHTRYHVGAMELEDEDPATFIGLNTVWYSRTLTVWPTAPDPWAATLYNRWDVLPVRHWRSWGPPSQRHALAIGIFCRAAYLSSSLEVRREALWDAFIMLRHRAGFPEEFVVRLAQKWARSWKPRRPVERRAALITDVDQAASRAARCAAITSHTQ